MQLLTFGNRTPAQEKWNVEERLKGLEIFSKLNDRQIRKLARLFLPRSYRKGEVLIKKGDTGLGMFLVADGRVEVYDTRDGNRVILAILDPGKCVGEMSLMDARPRSANVEAIEDTECLLMTRDSFNSLTRRDPEILWGIVPLLAERLRRANERLSPLGEPLPITEAQAAVIVETGSVAVVEEPAATRARVDADISPVSKARARDEAAADDEDDEKGDGTSEEGNLFSSLTQLSTASFMLWSSAFVLATQESLRVFSTRDSVGKRLSRSEEVVSSLTSKVEENMNDESKRLFQAMQEMMSSIVAIFQR
jgi:CRP-like cAMP-binding protein